MNLQPPLTSRVASLPDGNRTEALAMPGTLDHTLVHKSDPANVFVASIMRADATPDGYDCFIANLHIDPSHPFFFEHPLDHVPGLMLIEANRQVGTAISHRFYEVSHNLAFVLNSLDVVFEHFAELSAPLLARFVIVAKTYRHDHLSALTCESQWLQFDRPVGTMNARWSFSPPALLARLRRNAAAGEVH
ncbi:AfsA-related hotdog domain-containing protein [Pandoraea communis]|uniref:AfsA-related hotdog domain-containing protein n=1 Tax=Pandoraea communis TaxID=2508297 RepID=UPI0025A59C55|nr:AfsA-related hotdog domain-containing protein [Pandoraea communis]MDM8359617.1 AfsA-related hotdog domain-containing protein [Pandoraea communis]